MLRRRRWGQGKAVLLEPVSPDASEEERFILAQALQGLPLEQREVIYLKVFEGHTLREIAELCGISINTVGSRYRYGLAALRHALRSETL
jgi:RNA polymerase sigma-70 factor (ECF subfamily)